MSSIKAIAIRNRPRVAMQAVDSARVTVAGGILGDFRGSQRGRQVTILSESAWRQACAEIDTDLPWTVRRANLLVDDVEFDESYVGKTVRIGDVELVVTAETDPCSRMDAQRQGLTAALTPAWRGGVCCNVVKPGDINIGDSVEFA
ncbi:MAG: MOSC domain-containing protein [Gammaproteobacteria bacterium]|nr:MOSC domain-containing protein [Gammaproteobacteria bacterium]MDH3538294.1 MOSC domain-containing protein [Gammaproteobacteria bacterium]